MSEFADMAKEFRSFNQVDPKYLDEYRLDVPKYAWQLGQVYAIAYVPVGFSMREGVVYEHEFSPFASPVLAATPDQLIILGGRYNVTGDHGIVDKKDRG